MESPPSVEGPPAAGGVATLPPASSHLRSLISASQGPQPLSSMYAYRTRMNRGTTTVVRASARYVAPVASGPAMARSARASVSLVAESGAADAKEDERKPPPRAATENFTAARTARWNMSSSPEVSHRLRRTGLEPDSVAAPAALNPGTPSPVMPYTRSLRKRRSSQAPSVLPNAKRPAVASIDDKPAALKTDPGEFSDAGSCCICMCDPEEGESATIDGCEHEFCFQCIEQWSERENTCPLCKNRFNRINRVNKGKRKKGQKSTKKVKQRDQRADLNSHNTLEGILAGLNANAGLTSSIARLIFSGVGTSTGVIDFGISATNSSGGLPSQNGPPSQPRWRNPSSQIEDALFSDNDDEGSDDDGIGYSNFVDSMRRMNGRQRGPTPVFGAYPVIPGRPARSAAFAAAQAAAAAMAPPPRFTRSYATNAHDANAGGTADNALEIEDDSDEDEVIDVWNGGRNV